MTRDSFASLGFHIGADFRVSCLTYPDSARKPILSLDLGRVSVSLSANVSSTDHTATEGDVTRARELAEAVAVYVAEIERLYARCSMPSTSAESTDHPDDESTIKPAGSGRAA